MNKLYFGDNLEILCEMGEGKSITLPPICAGNIN